MPFSKNFFTSDTIHTDDVSKTIDSRSKILKIKHFKNIDCTKKIKKIPNSNHLKKWAQFEIFSAKVEHI